MASDHGQGQGHDKEVEIEIDGKTYTSPTPTTGKALYLLASVPAGYAIFREVKGKGDDEAIKNDDSPVKLHKKDEFYTAQSDLNPGT